ncbi:unnamed protein product, partial [Ceratitis capitata]
MIGVWDMQQQKKITMEGGLAGLSIRRRSLTYNQVYYPTLHVTKPISCCTSLKKHFCSFSKLEQKFRAFGSCRLEIQQFIPT